MDPQSLKICNKVLSSMFLTEIPSNYTSNDIESAQMEYISSGNCSIEHLCSFRSKCPEILIETLVLIYDSLEISGLPHFPFSIFRQFISDGDLDGISLTQKICEMRPNFYINLLYSVCHKRENTRKFLSNISVVLNFKNCTKILKNREIWGLSRSRSGFYTKTDLEILNLCVEDALDITQVNKIKLQLNSNITADDGFMKDERFVDPSNFVAPCYIFLMAEPEPYHLPFFFQEAFSQIIGFSPSDKVSSKEIVEQSNIINQIYEILHPLLLDLQIKSNFTDFILNICSQDRAKLVFEESSNCTDSLCYTVCHLLLKLAKGILNNGFISKIDDKKFPTFCFFNIARLMEISLSKLLNDLKEDHNKNNSTMLLCFENHIISEYFAFVFNLIDQRQNEVYKPLESFLQNIDKSNQDLAERIENVSIDSNIKNIKQLIYESSYVLPFTPEDLKANSVSQILNDASFISTILSLYAFYQGLRKETNKAVLSLINCLFAYKNTFAIDCLYVMVRSDFTLNRSLISRIINLYSLKDDNSYYEARHIIHILLKECSFEINRDTLRMISASLGGMEENISLIFDYIQKINGYNRKDQELDIILRKNTEECFLSEDEEKITLFPDRFLDLAAGMSEEQLDRYLRSRFNDSELEEIKQNIRDNLLYRHNEFKLKVFKKIKINKSRKERSEKSLKGSVEYLNSLLVFVKNHTERNRKVFLNKNIFFRLFSTLNSALNLLVGEKSGEIKIPKKEAYGLDPKEILRQVVLIIINMLRANDKLVFNSELNPDLVQKAINLCSSKYILNDDQIRELEIVADLLKSTKEKESLDNSPIIDDIPDDFLDPLTFIIMKNPVVMKTSKTTIDMTTFNQIMLNDQLDPFSRQPINETLIFPNEELKKRIEQFLKDRGINE